MFCFLPRNIQRKAGRGKKKQKQYAKDDFLVSIPFSMELLGLRVLLIM